MSGVPRELAEHRIDVNEGSKPIKQRLRRFSLDKKEAILLSFLDYYLGYHQIALREED
jgi:hypothetical protein